MKIKSLITAGLLVASVSANAGILRVTEGAFVGDAGLITFSEFSVGTVNPTYNAVDYGGAAGSPTVNFDGAFDFSGPTIALDGSAPDAVIVSDGAAPNSPVLSGTPTFNGNLAVLFDVDVAGVGLDAGYFDAIGGTAIEAFDRAGNSLGSVLNESLGIEFLGLVTDDGLNGIAGLFFHIVGNEPAGYAIDSLRFGRQGDVVVPTVPEPGVLALIGLGLVGVALGRRV